MRITTTAAKADALRKEAARLHHEADGMRGNSLETKEVAWWSQETGDIYTMRNRGTDPEALRLWRMENPSRDYARWFRLAPATVSPESWDRIFDLEQRARELENEADEIAGQEPKRRPGPAARLDWNLLREKAFEALDDRGQVGVSHDWLQADLVRLLLDIMAAELGTECDPSLMKKKVRRWCSEWADAVQAGRRN